MKKILFLLYAVIAYITFLGTILYSIGFVGNVVVPKSIDGIPEVPLWQAILTNTIFLLLFAAQHSIMARPAFKKWWTKIIPEPIERTTYVMLSNIFLIAVMYFWEPMGGVVWSTDNPMLTNIICTVFFAGWGIVLLSTFMINHFDLFGLRQVWMYFRGKPYTHLKFQVPYLYKYMRHPLYLGFLIGFWVVPTMTVTHLLFAVATTGYILVAIQFEERDLVGIFGNKYREYRKRVPMLFPFGKKNPDAAVSYQISEQEQA